MKNIKLFENITQYESYKNGSDFILPNVSYVEDIDIVMFNPYVEPASPNLVCVYNITDTSKETKIIGSYAGSYFTSMIVDGVEMELDIYYQFNTVGNHIIEFVLDDPTSIRDNAFLDCQNLTSVTIPDGVTSIGGGAFLSCNNLTSINIPDGVTSIGGGAFFSSSLTSIVIPNSVTTIENNAFYNCSSLTSVTIPDSVTSIGYLTFYNCSSLTSVTIPDSVTSIENDIFSLCSSLTSITCYAPTAPSIKSSTFKNISKGGTLYVPTGSDYSSWMGTDNYYLGKYNWTIQYI